MELLLFQYISCCSLSSTSHIGLIIKPQFQYISCCSLSGCLAVVVFALGGFNTSHVVVYQ